MAKDLSNWQKRFFTIWTGQALSLVGSQLVQFALIWWLTETTNSTTVLAIASLMALLPRVALSPLSGTLVDRWNRQRIMILSDAVTAFLTALLGLLFWLGLAKTWHVEAIIFFRAVAGTLQQPAMTASTSLMVPKAHLPRVAGMNQALGGLLDIGAPLLGALLLGLLPLQGILAIDVGTAALAIAPLLVVTIPHPARGYRERPSRKPSLVSELGEGLRFIRSWPGLFINVSTFALVCLFIQPTSTYEPIMIRDAFGGGSAEFGLASSAYGVGIIAGGLILGVWGGFRRRMTTVLIGALCGGLLNLVRGAAPANGFWLFAAATLLVGFAGAFEGLIETILQTTVPPEMQGRVFGLIASIIHVAGPLSLVVSAPLAEAWGVRPFYLLRGIVTIGVTAVMFLVPAVRNLEDGPPVTAVELA